MNACKLMDTARTLVAADKGLLAMDEDDDLMECRAVDRGQEMT
jgi:hypothetical protein